MSKKVVLLGDMGTGHHGFPPTPVIAGSPDVLIDGKPVARVGDPLAPHSKPKHPPHPRAIAAGSATVLINGIPAAVTGSAISCGGVTIGSGSVVIGDTHAPAAFSGAAAVPAGPQVAPLHTEQTSQASPESSGVNVSESADQSVAAPESSASSISGLRPGIDQEQGTTEPGYHVVQAPMSKMALLAALYGDASAKPANFDRLNPGLGDQVLPGEMVVLGDPEGLACTQIEADLMALAAQVNAQVRTLDQQDAQFIVKYYDLLEVVTATGSAGLGAGAVMVSRQIESIERTLKAIERLHQDSYRQHGHLNHPEFFEKRRALFKNLDFSLGRLARKGMSLDDDAKLKRALGLSSKSVVHHWKTAGVGDIPGYATHYERLAKGARYARNVGYLGITLDATLSAMNIHEACTTGDDKACQVVAYREGGRLLGSMGGGSIGAGASYGCVALGVGTAGIGGVACVVLVGGIGAAAGSYAGSEFGEFAGEILREAIHE